MVDEDSLVQIEALSKGHILALMQNFRTLILCSYVFCSGIHYTFHSDLKHHLLS